MFEQSMERARQAYATGRPAEAISALAAAGAEATTADQWRRIAGTHRRFGRLELAAAAFREVIGRQPRRRRRLRAPGAAALLER